MKRAVVGSALAVLGLAVVAVGLWAWFVRPFRTLPRPAEAIQADWKVLTPQMPLATRPNPSQRQAFVFDDDPTQATPEQIDAVLQALAAGARMPTGCIMLADLKDEPIDPAPMQVFHVARALLEHGHPEAAAQLGADLLDGDFFSVAVAIPILTLAREAGVETTAPTLEHARLALLREAACGDATIDLLDSPSAPDGMEDFLGSAMFDLEIARLRYRDRATALIACLDAPDPQSCLSALPPPSRYAPLTRVLAVWPSAVSDVLSGIDAWSIQPAP